MKCYIQPGLNFHPTSLEFVVDETVRERKQQYIATINNKRYGND